MAEVRRATSLGDAMRMRRVRNEVRGYMTNDRSFISVLRQVRWYRRRLRAPGVEGYLVWDGGEAVGYGLITMATDGRWWVAGGVLERWRGCGFGRLLFRHISDRAAELSGRRESWLDVMNWNERAQKLYRSLGYRATEVLTDRTVMVRQLAYPVRATGPVR